MIYAVGADPVTLIGQQSLEKRYGYKKDGVLFPESIDLLSVMNPDLI